MRPCISQKKVNNFCKYFACISQEEFIQFKRIDIWDLVLHPIDKTIIDTRWIFRNKMDENGVITKNKARLVAKLYSQVEGITYDETYCNTSNSIKLFN